MNKFDEMKQKILETYPSVKNLPWHVRLRTHFMPKGKHSMTIEQESGRGHWTQYATLVEINGKDYVYCWGFSK